ncbi:IQ and AAA domain-containing protein 1-like [Prorops nasuta]|uniref:IQ and AAA domain-containing protein 1-like n=1 Tax=Prorops nasuta TaxID=863751 RepID=UPI0034CE31D2
MSFAYYDKLWLRTRNDLEKILALERSHQEAPPIKEKRAVLNFLLPTYLKYKHIVQNLVMCHDATVHSQYRECMKNFLERCIARMLEFKREILNKEFSDYLWPDHHMVRLKFTPDDLNIPPPRFVKGPAEQRRKFLEELIDDALADEEETMTVSTLEIPEVIDKKKASLMLQSHERARVARIIATDDTIASLAKKIYDYRRKKAMEASYTMPVGKKMTRSMQEKAALKIQCAWRGYLGRKAAKQILNNLESLLGMNLRERDESIFEVDRQILDNRLKACLDRDEHLYPSLLTPTFLNQLLEVRAPIMLEEICEEIREWFNVWYKKVGFFGPFPPEKQGGTILIVTEEEPTPEEFLKKSQDKQEVPEETNKKDEKSKKGEEGWKMSKSKNLENLIQTNREFLLNYGTSPGLSSCLLDKRKIKNFYMELIIGDICHDMHLEMRRLADDKMRIEWDLLNVRLNKLHKKDVPTWKNPTWKKGKRRNAAGQSKKGKKQDKFANVPPKDLFDELARFRIIRKYPATYLKDWLGDYAYANYEARLEFRPHEHRIGEVCQPLVDNCILPLASTEAHANAVLTKAVAICGAPRTGKTFLVNAIATEVGALLIDLSPQNLVKKYIQPPGEPQKLMDAINKVARYYSPTIVLVDPGEKPWLKKITPEEKATLQPNKFTKQIEKFVKGIKAGDQILFLTTSSEPYKAKKPYIKLHNKFIIIPDSDYNSLYILYKYLFLKYPGLDKNIDVSSLAKESIGYPLNVVKEAVEKVLCLRRRITFRSKPFSQLEILDELLKNKPDPKAAKLFDKFKNKLPINKKRLKLFRNEETAYKVALAARKK